MRTCVIPEHDLTLSVMADTIDGWAGLWADGAMHILRAFSQRGAASRQARDWAGRRAGSVGGPRLEQPRLE